VAIFLNGGQKIDSVCVKITNIAIITFFVEKYDEKKISLGADNNRLLKAWLEKSENKLLNIAVILELKALNFEYHPVG
jgi:hypothetical protein